MLYIYKSNLGDPEAQFVLFDTNFFNSLGKSEQFFAPILFVRSAYVPTLFGGRGGPPYSMFTPWNAAYGDPPLEDFTGVPCAMRLIVTTTATASSTTSQIPCPDTD